MVRLNFFLRMCIFRENCSAGLKEVPIADWPNALGQFLIVCNEGLAATREILMLKWHKVANNPR